jgi:hypothetical protein
MSQPDRPWYRSRTVWYLASLLALGGVFVSYLRPDLMFALANLVWSCF